MPTIKSTVNLTDKGVMRLAPGYHRDKLMSHLLVRVARLGVRAFYFYDERMVRRKRIVTHRLLGHRPPMEVREARRQCFIILGQLAAGVFEPGKRQATKFGDALDKYIAYLKSKSPTSRWPVIVEGYARNHLRPRWGDTRLIDMARSPDDVAEWHRDLTASKGPVAANHCARLIRAVYMRAARGNVSLPRDRHPCTTVDFNVEHSREIGITDWRAWSAAWRKIENPTRKAYHLFSLLSGCRPGEAARVRWDGLDAKRRTLTIKKSKAGLDVTIPLSLPLCRVLRMARDANGEPRDYIFPARGPKGHIVRFDSDDLSVYANSLRHTYTSLAAALGIDELTIDMLTTHVPRGVSQKYFVKMIVNSGPAMRQAQARISAEIMKKAGLSPGLLSVL